MRKFAAAVVMSILFGCSWDSQNLLTTGEGTTLLSLEVRDSTSKVVWRISSLKGFRPVDRVEYGVIPEGFRQEFPSGSARPRPFANGESLTLIIDTTKSTLEQQANAVGPKGVAPGGYTLSEK